MRGWIAVLVACGCGRIGFDPGDAGLAIDSRPCPNGYTAAGASCYRAVATPEAAWNAAEAACEADGAGAHLVVVDDATEAAVLTQLTAASLNFYWVGFTDLVTEGVYLTVTNLPIGFATWSSGQPEGAGENCLYLTTIPDLHDHPCGNTNDYVCEFDGEPAVPAAFTP